MKNRKMKKHKMKMRILTFALATACADLRDCEARCAHMRASMRIAKIDEGRNAYTKAFRAGLAPKPILAPGAES